MEEEEEITRATEWSTPRVLGVAGVPLSGFVASLMSASASSTAVTFAAFKSGVGAAVNAAPRALDLATPALRSIFRRADGGGKGQLTHAELAALFCAYLCGDLEASCQSVFMLCAGSDGLLAREDLRSFLSTMLRLAAEADPIGAAEAGNADETADACWASSGVPRGAGVSYDSFRTWFVGSDSGAELPGSPAGLRQRVTSPSRSRSPLAERQPARCEQPFPPRGVPALSLPARIVFADLEVTALHPPRRTSPERSVVSPRIAAARAALLAPLSAPFLAPLTTPHSVASPQTRAPLAPVAAAPSAPSFGGTFESTSRTEAPLLPGLVHVCATKGGALPWSCPVLAGEIATTRSSECPWNRVDARSALGREPVESGTYFRFGDGWQLFDFGHNRRVMLDAYAVRHGRASGRGRLRNWVLEGSVDGESWSELSRHGDDDTLADIAFATARWPVSSATARAMRSRYLRLRVTGANSSGLRDLWLCGFEIYGELLAAD